MEQKGEWDECLPYAISAYNKSVHSSTGFAPHELVFGKRANVPIEEDDTLGMTYEELLHTLQDKLRFLHDEAITKQIEKKGTTKERYDKHTRPIYFKENDLVAIKNHKHENKLDKRYLGPYTVVSASDSKCSYHYKDVKPYNTRLMRLLAFLFITLLTFLSVGAEEIVKPI